MLNSKSVLEIGIGDGLVSNYLKNKKVNIITMDIDRRLEPDYIGSIFSMPFRDKRFEAIACFEVFEHLSYCNFRKALSETYRVSNKYALISLPGARKAYLFYIKIPKIKEFKFLIPFLFPYRRHKLDGEHYWEIGKKGYFLKSIFKDKKV